MSAQSLELSSGINHQTNGLFGYYNLPLSRTIELGLGLRYAINTSSLNENRQGHAFYQNGYALNFWQHFGLAARPAVRLVHYKGVALDWQLSLQGAKHGMREKGRAYDSLGALLYRDVFETPAGLSVEVVTGLRLTFQLSSKLSILASCEVGAVWMNYSSWSRSLVDGSSRQMIVFTPRFFTPNGIIEMSGIEALPNIHVGVRYKIK